MTNKTNEPRKEAAATAQPEQKAPPLYAGQKQFMYVGPPLPGSSLQRNMILTGSYDAVCRHYAKDFKKYPLAAKLVVPVSGLAATRQAMEREGGRLNSYCAELSAQINQQEE